MMAAEQGQEYSSRKSSHLDLPFVRHLSAELEGFYDERMKTDLRQVPPPSPTSTWAAPVELATGSRIRSTIMTNRGLPRLVRPVITIIIIITTNVKRRVKL